MEDLRSYATVTWLLRYYLNNSSMDITIVILMCNIA